MWGSAEALARRGGPWNQKVQICWEPTEREQLEKRGRGGGVWGRRGCAQSWWVPSTRMAIGSVLSASEAASTAAACGAMPRVHIPGNLRAEAALRAPRREAQRNRLCASLDPEMGPVSGRQRHSWRASEQNEHTTAPPRRRPKRTRHGLTLQTLWSSPLLETLLVAR